MSNGLIEKLEKIAEELKGEITPIETQNKSELEKINKQKQLLEEYPNNIEKFLEIDFSIIELYEKQASTIEECKQIISNFLTNGSKLFTKEFITKLICDNQEINDVIAKLKIAIALKESQLQENLTAKNTYDLITKFINIYQNDSPEYIENTSEIKKILAKFRDLFDYKDRYNLLSYIGIHNVDVNNIRIKELESKKIVQREITIKISKEELKIIFENYGYDINKLDEESLNNIIQHNTKENIIAVFEFFKSQNLSLLNKNNKYNKALINIIARGSQETINSVVEICSQNNINLSNVIMKHPSVFKNKSSVRNIDEHRITGSGSNSTDNEESNNQDFISNCNLFKSLGYNVESLYHECSCVLLINNKRNERLVNKLITTLKEYGIDIDGESKKLADVISTTAWLKGTIDSSFVIHQFVELDDNLNYIVNNATRLLISKTSKEMLILYRLKNYILRGIPYMSEHRNNCLITEITKSNNTQTGINNLEEQEALYKHEIFSETVDNQLRMLINKNYTLSQNIVDNPYVKTFDEQYLIKPYLYSIDGVLISRPKMLHVFDSIISSGMSLNISEAFIYALTYDSLLTEEEFNKVRTTVLNLKLINSNLSVNMVKDDNSNRGAK